MGMASARMPITSLAASPMSFKGSSRFSLGVEEELIAVDAVTLLPCGGTEELLARAGLAPEQVTGEVTDGVLELRTPVCDDAGEAVGVLGALRAAAERGHAAARRGRPSAGRVRRRAAARAASATS